MEDVFDEAIAKSLVWSKSSTIDHQSAQLCSQTVPRFQNCSSAIELPGYLRQNVLKLGENLAQGNFISRSLTPLFHVPAFGLDVLRFMVSNGHA